MSPRGAGALLMVENVFSSIAADMDFCTNFSLPELVASCWSECTEALKSTRARASSDEVLLRSVTRAGRMSGGWQCGCDVGGACRARARWRRAAQSRRRSTGRSPPAARGAAPRRAATRRRRRARRQGQARCAAAGSSSAPVQEANRSIAHTDARPARRSCGAGSSRSEWSLRKVA